MDEGGCLQRVSRLFPAYVTGGQAAQFGVNKRNKLVHRRLITIAPAVGAVPAGLGVVEGGKIPYQPWAAEKKKENLKNWLTTDPEIKCYLPGVPRATYMPFPFQVVQTPKHILLTYEFASASPIVHMDRPDLESPIDTWMGHSRGRWDGETLLVDVTSFNDQTWFEQGRQFPQRYLACGRALHRHQS